MAVFLVERNIFPAWTHTRIALFFMSARTFVKELQRTYPRYHLQLQTDTCSPYLTFNRPTLIIKTCTWSVTGFAIAGTISCGLSPLTLVFALLTIIILATFYKKNIPLKKISPIMFPRMNCWPSSPVVVTFYASVYYILTCTF